MSWLAAAPVEYPLKFRFSTLCPLGSSGDDAGRAVRVLEALRDQAYAETAHRLAEIGVIAHVAEVEFIDHGGMEGLGMAQREELCAAGGDGIETRDAGAALRDRIRVIEIEVVDEVIAGEQAQAGIRIEANRSLIVAHRLVERRGRIAVGGVRSGNVLQHSLRRNRPGVLRNDGVGKNALGRIDATGNVVRLTRSHGIAQLLREQVGEVRAAHHAGQVAGKVGRDCPGDRRSRAR